MQSWLYKKGFEPQLFGDSALKDAYKDGWVDSPAKIDLVNLVSEESDNPEESLDTEEPVKQRGRPKKV